MLHHAIICLEVLSSVQIMFRRFTLHPNYALPHFKRGQMIIRTKSDEIE